ncbi:MAG: hypothetical protein IJW32_00685, partial [Clostridia bacterium]|nr:hypothetical protein [Clostridia bacterium]
KMWQSLLELALTNGIWSALFVGLLIYQLKDSSKREKKYQDTIQKLNSHLDAVQDIKEEIKEIRSVVLTSKGGK